MELIAAGRTALAPSLAPWAGSGRTVAEGQVSAARLAAAAEFRIADPSVSPEEADVVRRDLAGLPGWVEGSARVV
ncbi:hypothetical protein N5079_23185 [Planotetraspora sp. A-T 1434]|uniref:hypothetical protein n=1 Tax=Planotetraspora sp. A-T 1434 TaxID=2979219 RepID=UPI0021BFD755|nr:hypothetical protein [Planotetraspora sp. A-T 1434]MCT9933117.1 hypothetical protein [Planotetraspora sp. A-T 1434]